MVSPNYCPEKEGFKNEFCVFVCDYGFLFFRSDTISSVLFPPVTEGACWDPGEEVVCFDVEVFVHSVAVCPVQRKKLTDCKVVVLASDVSFTVEDLFRAGGLVPVSRGAHLGSDFHARVTEGECFHQVPHGHATGHHTHLLSSEFIDVLVCFVKNQFLELVCDEVEVLGVVNTLGQDFSWVGVRKVGELHDLFTS